MHLWSPHAETQVENLVQMAKLCSSSSLMLKNITRPLTTRTSNTSKARKVKTLTRKLISAAILCVHGGWRLDFLSTAAGTGKSKMKSLPHTAPKLEEQAILISTSLHQLQIKKLQHTTTICQAICHLAIGMGTAWKNLWPSSDHQRWGVFGLAWVAAANASWKYRLTLRTLWDYLWLFGKICSVYHCVSVPGSCMSCSARKHRHVASNDRSPGGARLNGGVHWSEPPIACISDLESSHR